MEGPAQLADFIAGMMDISAAEKQKLLETFDLKTRLDRLLELLAHRIEVLKVSRDIDARTQESLDDRNRKHLLRERMRTIKRNLARKTRVGGSRRDRQGDRRCENAGGCREAG